MTIVRQLNSSHDWTFGQSKNNYLSGNAAIAQNINTRLYAVLGNCFFDLSAGINWFNLLGSNQQTQLSLSISNTILNTPNVTGLLQLSIKKVGRALNVVYQVQTVYSTTASTFVFDTSVGG